MLRLAASKTRQQIRPRTWIQPLILSPNNSNVPDTNEQQQQRQRQRQYASTLSGLTISVIDNHTQFSPSFGVGSNHPWNASARRNFWSWSGSKKEDASSDNGTSNVDAAASSSTSNPPSGGSVGDSSFESSSATAAVDESTTSSSATESATANVDDTLDQLFAENQDQVEAAADAMAVIWEPTWYNLADQAIVLVRSVHEVTGLEWGWTIVGCTALLRFVLFPLMVLSQRNASRMAHVNPELKQMQARYEALGTPTRQDQMQFSTNMKNLFKRYEVNPLKSLAAPVVQIPLFMGMFFGLRKICDIYPQELSQGGMLWFVDLTQSDPFYILPLTSGLSLMALTELTKDQVAQGPSGEFMINFMRLMSVVMIPVMINFDTAMLCYWTTNNLFTIAQTKLLMTKSVRDYFGIWDQPKPVPGTKNPPSLMEQLETIAKRIKGEPTTEKAAMEKHNRAIETKKKAFQMMNVARDRRSNSRR